MALTNYPTAGLLHRLLAMAYDGLVLIGFCFMVYAVVISAIARLMGTFPEMPVLGLAPVLSIFYSTIFLYYMHSWRRGGQTIGMKAWRLYLTTEDNSPVRLSHCILRSGAGFFSLGIVGLGFFWMLIDKRQRTWHDIASVTRIVHKPKGVE